MGQLKNIAQARAQFAYNKVADLDNNTEMRKEFKSYVKDIPMMIRHNGLAAAFAFAFSKKDKGQGTYATITRITQDWLQSQAMVLEVDAEEFYGHLTTLDHQSYRRVTREVLALFTWLKRYADGMIQEDQREPLNEAAWKTT